MSLSIKHRVVQVVVVVALVSLTFVSVTAQEKATEPPETVTLKVQVNALKGEVVELRLQLSQALAQLEAAAVVKERQEIEALVSKEAPGYSVDWQTGELKAPDAQPEK